ncbi:hypothetical protein R6Q59_017525, partial [Mikania micrantha]
MLQVPVLLPERDPCYVINLLKSCVVAVRLNWMTDLRGARELEVVEIQRQKKDTHVGYVLSFHDYNGHSRHEFIIHLCSGAIMLPMLEVGCIA